VRVTCSFFEFKNNAGGITIAYRQNPKVVWEIRIRFMSYVISGEISKSCRAFDSWRMKAQRCISILFTARKCAGGSPRKGLATNARITCLSRKKPEPVAAKKEKLLCLTRRNIPASRSSIKLPRHEPVRFETMSVLLRNDGCDRQNNTLANCNHQRADLQFKASRWPSIISSTDIFEETASRSLR
jgi:hypothetical protein